jgi:hypothetical protein
VRLRFADGSTEAADVLVGADGVGSAVRRTLLPDAPIVDTGSRVSYGKTPLDDAARRLVPPAMYEVAVEASRQAETETARRGTRCGSGSSVTCRSHAGLESGRTDLARATDPTAGVLRVTLVDGDRATLCPVRNASIK